MPISQANLRNPQGMRRRDVLKAGLAAGVTLSAWLQTPTVPARNRLASVTLKRAKSWRSRQGSNLRPTA